VKALAVLVFFITTASAPAVALLPPGTNDLAAFQLAMEARRQNHFYYLNGKVDLLEHEVERLEIGFLAVSVLVGATGLAICLLAARDRIRARKTV
jgi:hypothetical protein